MPIHGEQLKKLLIDRELTLAVAESLTSGNIQAAIGGISGASNFFAGGITAYNIDQKVNLLKVDHQHAEKVDCVSQRIADEMAQGVAHLFQTDIGIGTTGYAEPYPEQNVAEPYAFFAIWRRLKDSQDGEIVVSDRIEGGKADRKAMQLKVTEKSVHQLIEYLQTS